MILTTCTSFKLSATFCCRANWADRRTNGDGTSHNVAYLWANNKKLKGLNVSDNVKTRRNLQLRKCCLAASLTLHTLLITCVNGDRVPGGGSKNMKLLTTFRSECSFTDCLSLRTQDCSVQVVTPCRLTPDIRVLSVTNILVVV